MCASCWNGLHLIEPPYCERLGIPFAYDPGGDAVSPQAVRDPPAYWRARSVCLYGDTAKALVHGLKFHDRHDMVVQMVRLMARSGRQLIAEADLICPVPLHRMRLWRRRFNQSALLGEQIARNAGKPWAADLLIRTRATRQQVGLSHEQRRRNVAGAFMVNDAGRYRIARTSILLVDDVFTTGATVEACTRALLKAGARNVDVLTFARVAETIENPI